MKIVIPGGSGHVGTSLIRYFLGEHCNLSVDEIVVLERNSKPDSESKQIVRHVLWDGRTLGDWQSELDGADVVINLVGRSVNCRYTPANVAEMLSSRVDSTAVIGQAIAKADKPPSVWLQASTATIYRHSLTEPNDDVTGVIGDQSDSSPEKWKGSVEIAKAWEKALENADTPSTRKVAMRSAMTMSPDQGSIFHVLHTLAKRGLYGTQAGGRQVISWIHELDFCRALEHIISNEFLSGPINICSPNPLPQKEFASILRSASNAPFGIPAPVFAVKLGAMVMQTETELVLKSRYVVPKRLLDSGFEFTFPEWHDACTDLVERLESSPR